MFLETIECLFLQSVLADGEVEPLLKLALGNKMRLLVGEAVADSPGLLCAEIQRLVLGGSVKFAELRLLSLVHNCENPRYRLPHYFTVMGHQNNK